MDNKNKAIKKNVYQKFAAFRANFFEMVNSKKYPNVNKLTEEQESFIFYSDDVIVTEKGNYVASIIHFVDIETGDEVTSKSIVLEKTESGDNTKRSRSFALKALLGYVDNFKSFSEGLFENEPEKKENQGQNKQSSGTAIPASPTPARTQAEPNGGVPKGFTSFSK